MLLVVFKKNKEILMKKEKRVKTKQDFQKVIAAKKKISSNIFVIYYLSNDKQESRYGISASKKLGNAVMRVKIRRQVRSMIVEIERFENIIHLDFVIIVRRKFLNNNYHDNLEELKKMLLKIGGMTNE